MNQPIKLSEPNPAMTVRSFALFLIALLSGAVANAQTGTGLTAKYYDDQTFGSAALKTTRTDATINFDWTNGIPSGTAITSGDTFGVAWSGQIEPEFSELYTFYLTADDSARLWVNDQCIVLRSFYQGAGEMRGQIRLKGAHKTNIRVEYLENTGNARAKLEWASYSQPRQVVPSTRLYPTTEVPNGGSVMREVWHDLPGSSLSTLTSNANYPNKPASREFISTFECLAKNWEDSYGTRVTGFVRAPITGTYTFAVSGNDVVQLYLSTDASSSNKTLIASTSSATAFRDFGANASQQSVPLNLVAGQRYYVELLHKEDVGDDHWSVAWKQPGETAFSIIPGTALMMPGTTLTQPSTTALFNTLATEHPRLGVTRERFIWLKQMWQSPDASQAKSRAQAIINSAEGDLNAAPDSGRWGRDRLQRLALAWWLTGDPRYAEYAWTNIIEHAINNGDWTDPWKGLTNGLVAVGYDWFFPYWTQSRKDTMQARMISGYQSWDSSRTNNIGVILNSGHLEATLAMATVDSGAASKCSTALGRLNGFLDDWNANTGAWYEGTDYGILTKWACGQALPAVETALGSTYGLSLQPGFSNAALEPLFIASNTRQRFTFSDIGTSSEAAIGWANWWGRRYDALPVLDYSRQIGSSALNALYLPETTISPLQAGLKPDSAFRGPADASPVHQEVVTLREKWGDNNASFVGCMGGADGILAHDSMQSGTFQLMSRGKRWFWDLSSDNYSNPGNNSHTPNPNGADRWDYYRNRAEARNTLVINPGSGPDRVYNSSTRALITNYQSAPNGQRSFTVMDLTPKIAGATRVQRGFQLFNKRKQLLVQDEIVMSTPSTVWWFANFQNTSTTAAISPDATSVMLTQGTERLWCKIVSGGGTWTIRAAEPLPTSPNPALNSPNPTYSKLTIHLTNISSTTLAVWFVPLAPGEVEPTTLPTISALNTWNLVAQNEAPIASNGNANSAGSAPVDVSLPAFTTDDWTPSTQLTYAVSSPQGGTVSMLPDGITARFTPTSGFTGLQSFNFTATDADGAVSTPGTINFSAPPVVSNWTATASGNWSTGANWQYGTAPASGPGADVRFFSGQTLAAGTITATNDIGGTLDLNRLTLAGTGAATSVVGLGGNALNLVSNGLTAPEVTLSGSTSGFLYQIANPITLGSTTNFNASGSATFRFEGPITGPGGLTRSSSTSNLILAADNGYAGSTTIQAGTLQIGNDGATGTLGDGPVSIASGATLRIDRSGQATIPNEITGAGRVYVHGPANADVLMLTGESDFTGEVRVESGSLRVTRAGQLGSGTKNIIATGTLSTLRLDGSSEPVVLPSEFTVLTSNPNGAILNEAGDNEILGNVTLTSGAGSTRITSSGGTLTIAGNVAPNVTGRSLDLRGTTRGVIHGNLTDGSPTNFLTGLSKNDSGTWTLNGNNAITGGTTVSAGRLVINGNHASGNINVSSGATLAGRGSLTAAASVSGTLAPGDGVGTMNFGSTLAFGSAGRLQCEISTNSLNADRVSAAAALSITNGAKVDLVFNSPGSTTNFRLSFWRSSRTWNIASGSSLTGAFQMGTVSVDSAGQAVATYGSFTLQHVSNGVNLVWTPLAGFPVIDEPLVSFLQPLANPAALPNAESTLRITATAAGAGPVTYAWTAIGSEEVGSGDVTFGDPSAADTTVSISETGRYILRCTATNSVVSRSADLIIDVGPPEELSNALAVIDPGTAPAAAAGFLTQVAGSVSNASSTLWSLVSGPGSASFSNPASPTTPVVFSAAGNYLLRLTATNAIGEAWRELAVTVAALPSGFEDWQTANWPGVTDPNIIGPGADPDGDGATNAAEFLAGTDPKSNTSVPSSIWTHTASGTWSDAANWNPAIAPASNALTKLEFLTTITPGGNVTSEQNLGAPFTLQRLALNGTGPGTTTLTGGTISFATGGILDLGNGGILYDLATPLDLTAPTIVQGAPTAGILISGGLSGAGSLTKNSTGTLEISGNHSLAGTLNINAGTLRITGAGTSSGAISVKSSNLTISGNGSIAPTIGAALNLGSNGGAGTLQYDSAASSKFAGIVVGNGTNNAGVLNQTNGTLNASSLTLSSTFSGGTGTVTIGNDSGDAAAMNLTGNATVSAASSGALSTLTVKNTGSLAIAGNLLFCTSTSRPANGILTQTGGTVSAAGLSLSGNISDSTARTHTSVYNLNGGTLTTGPITAGAIIGSPSTGSHVISATFNFNGGTLKPAASSATFWNANPVVTAHVKDGGAKIDSAGFDITIGQALIKFPGATTDTLTKEGPGKLTLAGANTYTGPTTVNEGTLAVTGSLAATDVEVKNNASLAGTGTLGGNVTIRSGGRQAFEAAATAGSQIARTITGALTLEPGNIIDLTAAAPPAPGGPYILLTATGGITGTPGSVTLGGLSGSVVKNGNQLELTVTAPAGFASWIDDFGLVPADRDPTDDPDQDGMENLLEYVLNGNPSLSDPSILPALDAAGANFVFQFTRREDSSSDTTQVFEYGTDLTGWTPLSINAPTAAEVTLGTPSGGLQSVTVVISKTLAAPGGKLFGRLKAVQQP